MPYAEHLLLIYHILADAELPLVLVWHPYATSRPCLLECCVTALVAVHGQTVVDCLTPLLAHVEKLR